MPKAWVTLVVLHKGVSTSTLEPNSWVWGSKAFDPQSGDTCEQFKNNFVV